ncbi:MAG TPA: hypothetical protein VGC91_05870 [Pyrinomonadaceae bacterium]|jgi:hypothetical protein
MAEVLRVAAFTTVEFEDGDWDGPHRDEDTMSYKSKVGAASVKVTLNGTTVFDRDYPRGKTFSIVGNVIHLPEGSVPD